MLHKHCNYGIIIHVNNGGIGEVVNTLDCGSSMRGFDSHIPPHVDIKTNYLFSSFFCVIIITNQGCG